MNLSLFDYSLPAELIAQFPVRKREQSRLLVLDRAAGEIQHRSFKDITEFLAAGDTLVVNNTKVFKARLIGRRATGAKVEIFLVRRRETDSERWLALVTKSRRVKEGEKILFDDQPPVVLEKDIGGGSWLVSFSSKTARERTVSHFGHVPLPHYIRREDQPGDIRRYQTVFADPDRVGAVAAPTAGFHFTRPLLNHLRGTGIFIAQLTLHVGPGTFKPIQTDRIEDHVVDPEYAELTAGTADALNATRKRGGKIVAVGTTSVRTLESAPMKNGKVQPFSGMVDLYIRPGHRFKMVDHLVTNFHLPKSSLLILVSAFAGREKILAAYREAINRHYRFYSYGDAMLIL